MLALYCEITAIVKHFRALYKSIVFMSLPVQNTRNDPQRCAKPKRKTAQRGDRALRKSRDYRNLGPRAGQ